MVDNGKQRRRQPVAPFEGLSLTTLRRISASALICIAVATTGTTSVLAAVSDESLELHKEAHDFLRQGDFQSAIIQFKNAIRADPDNVKARFDLAIIYLRGRDGPSAEKELKAAHKRGMDEAKILVPLARAYSLQGKNREIISEILPDGKTGKAKADILAARGSAYVSMKQLDLAEQSLNEAVTEMPDSAFVLVSYGQVLQALGKFAEAEVQIDRALVLEPENLLALIRKGALQQTQGNADGAIETLGKAIALNEDSIPALLARAGVYIASNNGPLARQDIDAVLQRAPNNPFGRYLSATLLASEKKYEEATDALQVVMSALSQYPPALYLRASLDFAQGRVEQAQSEVQSYLAKVPNSPRGRRLLAAIHLRKKDPERAIEILEPMNVQYPDDIRLMTLLGSAYVSAKRNAEATAIFEKVATQSPDNSAARTRLALSRLNGGDNELAVQEFESILENDPDETRANLLLVLTHLRAQEFDKSMAAAMKLKERMPDSPIPENFLGTIHVYKKDLETARKHFEQALALQEDFTPAALNLAEIDKNSGDIAGAKARYEKILAADGGNLQAMMRLSRMAFSESDTEDGVQWLARAIRENPRALAPRLALVNAYLQQEEFQRASTEAREAVALDDSNVDALDALARTQLAAENFPSAISTYRQIVKLVPDSPSAHYRFGRALIASQEYGEAITALEHSVALDPNNAPARQSLIGTILRDKGADAALARATKMREGNPDASFGYVLEAGVLMQKGEYLAASKAYENAQQREPSSQNVARMYQSLARAGEVEQGNALLSGWLEKHPEDSTIRFVYANALIRKKDFAAAIRENESLLQKFPDNAVLMNDLAWLYGEISDPRAVDFARKARKLAPKSPAIADTLGWLLVNNGAVEEGTGLLKEASEAAPDQLDINYHYAAALSRSGKEAVALKMLKGILDKGEPFSSIQAARDLYAKLVSK